MYVYSHPPHLPTRPYAQAQRGGGAWGCHRSHNGPEAHDVNDGEEEGGYNTKSDGNDDKTDALIPPRVPDSEGHREDDDLADCDDGDTLDEGLCVCNLFCSVLIFPPVWF